MSINKLNRVQLSTKVVEKYYNKITSHRLKYDIKEIINKIVISLMQSIHDS